MNLKPEGDELLRELINQLMRLNEARRIGNRRRKPERFCSFVFLALLKT
jgi:hypothetical protein